MGAIYVNKAAIQIKTANDLDLSKTKEYDELIGLANTNLRTALPFLEQAHKIDPSDKMTMMSLKEIYTRLNMMDKLKEINKKLGL
jgi:predicted transcriptional regulator